MHEILDDSVTDSGVLGIITHTRKGDLTDVSTTPPK